MTTVVVTSALAFPTTTGLELEVPHSSWAMGLTVWWLQPVSMQTFCNKGLNEDPSIKVQSNLSHKVSPLSCSKTTIWPSIETPKSASPTQPHPCWAIGWKPDQGSNLRLVQQVGEDLQALHFVHIVLQEKVLKASNKRERTKNRTYRLGSHLLNTSKPFRTYS